MRDPNTSLFFFHVTKSDVLQVLPQQGVDLSERGLLDGFQVDRVDIAPVHFVERVNSKSE